MRVAEKKLHGFLQTRGTRIRVPFISYSSFIIPLFVVVFFTSTCLSCLKPVTAFSGSFSISKRKTRFDSSSFSTTRPSTTLTGSPSSSTTDTSVRKDQSIHLLSLKWSELAGATTTDGTDTMQTTTTNEQLPYSKLVRDTWKWKDSVLGDGRDFFVPKPKTLTALNQAFLDTASACNLGKISVQECAIISNCARFEVILVCNHHHNDDDDDDGIHDHDDELLKQQIRQTVVCQTILRQLDYHKNQSNQNMFWKNQLSRFDWPDQICSSTNYPRAAGCDDNHTTRMMEEDSRVQELEQYWVHFHDPQQIVHHLSIMAAGIARRPNRPDRAVPFRPFSSRDAHILLQLKRTSEIASPITKLLLDTALSAGKAARNPQVVPQLSKLKSYGTGNSKYSVEAPSDLLHTVTQEAIQLGIDPIVQTCMDKLFTISVSDQITKLRTTCLDLALTVEEETIVKKLLHEPTVNLRKNNGGIVNQQDIVDQIQSQLAQTRKQTQK